MVMNEDLKINDMVTINGVDDGLYRVTFLFEKDGLTRLNVLQLYVNNQGWVIPKVVNNLFLTTVTKAQ